MRKRDADRRDRALERVRIEAEALAEAEHEHERRTKRRNAAMVRASRYAPATEIAERAGISHAFVSRVIREAGKPTSGSMLDRQRREAST